MLSSETIVASMIGVSAKNTHEVIAHLREGFPGESILRIGSEMELTHATLARLLNLPERSFARRLNAVHLSRHESEAIYRLARVYQDATTILGNRKKALRWLQKPNRSLANIVPLNLLDTDVGARQVEDALGHIAYGVYS